jgi:threonine/homoserine/homoserine lactone efflux protein
MVSIAELILGLVVLLFTPGPTNTLMAFAGAERGARRALALIPAELAAYLNVTLPLALVGTGLMGAVPGLLPVVTGAAAVWVAWLALRYWLRPADVQAGAVTVTAMRVFITTLLNPKALIIGLGLLPGTPLGPRVAVFAVLILAAASTWICLGALLAKRGQATARGLSPRFRRAAAVWLGLLSALLAYRAVT